MAEIDRLDGQNPSDIHLPPPPPLPCKDEHAECARWAEDGECANNPGFMHKSCAGSCGTCGGEHRVEL